MLSSHWSNGTPPKYIIDIFNSPYFKFECTNCTSSTSDISNTTTDSHLLNDIHNNVLINKNVINAIKSQVSDLITNASSKDMPVLKINDDNTIIFENLPTIKNLLFDTNYLQYFDKIISTNYDILLEKNNSKCNSNSKASILKVGSVLMTNYIIDNSKIKLNIISDFKNIFTRISLPHSEIRRKKVLFHAIKSKLVSSNFIIKCVLINLELNMNYII